MIFAVAIALVLSQGPTAKPDPATTAGFAATNYHAIQDFIVRAAEKMPPADFNFRPAAGVRSFAGILAHVADANYLLCSYALGEPNPNGAAMQGIEKADLEREALITKLKETTAYCDRAYAQLTEANGNELVGFFGGQKRTRAGLLWFHVSHAFEHYGNLVTYLRLKGIVPPTSEPSGAGREGAPR